MVVLTGHLVGVALQVGTVIRHGSLDSAPSLGTAGSGAAGAGPPGASGLRRAGPLHHSSSARSSAAASKRISLDSALAAKLKVAPPPTLPASFSVQSRVHMSRRYVTRRYVTRRYVTCRVTSLVKCSFGACCLLRFQNCRMRACLHVTSQDVRWLVCNSSGDSRL